MGTCAREWEISPQYVSIGMILLKAARFRLEFSYYSVFILVASRKSDLAKWQFPVSESCQA